MGRSSQTLHEGTRRRLLIVAMSRYSYLTLLVVVVISHNVSSNPFNFERLGAQKDNLIRAAGGFKAELLSPFIGIKRGLIDAKRGIVAPFVNLKTGLVKTKLGLVSGLVGAKAGLVKGVLRPVVGIKRSKLQALRGLIDNKISLLGRF